MNTSNPVFQVRRFNHELRPAARRIARFSRSAALLRPVIAGFILFLPGFANAQGTSAIAGVVRDSSGGVLPGVTVEATSSALIEKTRSVVSDESGRYNIINLPGGTYSVTFSLTGFSTIKRDGLELTANFTANVPVEMKVGGLEETLTVSGQASLVDVQTTSTQKVVSAETLFSLPITKDLIRRGGLDLDIYNFFNASPILSENVSYGPNWLRPTQILAPRLFKFGAKMTF